MMTDGADELDGDGCAASVAAAVLVVLVAFGDDAGVNNLLHLHFLHQQKGTQSLQQQLLQQRQQQWRRPRRLQYQQQ